MRRRPGLLVGLLVAASFATHPLSAGAVGGQAPAAPQAVPVVLDGTQAVVRWRVPDPAVTRVVVRRTLGTVAPADPLDGAAVFDGPPQAGLQLAADTVAIGSTYTYGYWSYDASGLVSVEATHQIKATAPAVLQAPALASDRGTGPRIALSWGNPANPVGTPYTVKYAKGGAWVIWRLDTPLTQAVFSAAVGSTVRFEVLSQDPYGNDTRHALATVVVPYDTRSATLSRGWQTLASSRRWGGTVAVATRAGAAVTFQVVGSQVTLIADTCPGCGRARVLVDGKVRALAETHARTLAVRQHVATVRGLRPGRHTVIVQVVGTAGRPAVHVDALAALD